MVHYRIDDRHNNAHNCWLEVGSPAKPCPVQMDELRAAAELALLEPVRFHDVKEGRLELEFPLPRYAVSLIEVRPWP